MIRKIKRRLDWYRAKITINNPVIGRAIELAGNRVRVDGLRYSVDSPHITAGQKCTIAFGYHEADERLLVQRWLPSSVPLLEFGGGLGVISCLCNQKLVNPEQHVVVEANPEMVPILERNRELNNCKFRIINKAIAYNCEQIQFKIASEFVRTSMIRNHGSKTIKVKTTSLSALMEEAGFERAGIVCDIEGAEADIIRHELPALNSRIEFFMAEMHPAILGQNVVDQLLEDFTNLGFVLKEKLGDNVFFSKR